MVVTPSSRLLHLQAVAVAERLELLLRAKMADQVVARRQIALLHRAAVVVTRLPLLHLKAITVEIVVRHLLTQIMLAVAVAEQVAWAEMLLLVDRAEAAEAVMEVQALPHHYQAALLFMHGAAQAAAIMMAITALPLLVHRVKLVDYQHLQTQVAAVMVEMKLDHG
jgi:hypothetical protein